MADATLKSDAIIQNLKMDIRKLKAENNTMAMTPELRQRIIKSLDWMVKDLTWRADQTKGNFEECEKGGYSPELTEAKELLVELKEGNWE